MMLLFKKCCPTHRSHVTLTARAVVFCTISTSLHYSSKSLLCPVVSITTGVNLLNLYNLYFDDIYFNILTSLGHIKSLLSTIISKLTDTLDKKSAPLSLLIMLPVLSVFKAVDKLNLVDPFLHEVQ